MYHYIVFSVPKNRFHKLTVVCSRSNFLHISQVSGENFQPRTFQEPLKTFLSNEYQYNLEMPEVTHRFYGFVSQFMLFTLSLTVN